MPLYISNISPRTWQTFEMHGNPIFIKETKSATMNIFGNVFFLFKSFVKVELSYVFTINLFSIAETAQKSELSYKTGVFFSCW